ncbi:MAG: outer membrane protein [Beijerinckiaceae bacterium]
MVRIATLKLLAAGMLLSLAGNAVAADRPLFSEDAPVVYGEKRQEFGSGWYLRGDVSWSRDKAPQLFVDGTFNDPPKQRNIFKGGLGFGYKFNNWFRTDITADYVAPQNVNGVSPGFICPIEIRGMNDANGDPIGIFAVENTCRSVQQTSLQRGVMLANAYLDLGTWAGVTPFVGAGAGMAYGRVRGSFDWYDTANNGPYSANLVVPGGFPFIYLDNLGNPIVRNYQFGPQNHYRGLSQTKFNFAWALMAGLAIEVSPNAKLEVGYRYMNLGKWGESKTANTSHDVRVGFRYMID